MQKMNIRRKSLSLRFDRYLSIISTTNFVITFLKMSLKVLSKADLIEAALILKFDSNSDFKELTNV